MPVSQCPSCDGTSVDTSAIGPGLAFGDREDRVFLLHCHLTSLHDQAHGTDSVEQWYSKWPGVGLVLLVTEFEASRVFVRCISCDGASTQTRSGLGCSNSVTRGMESGVAPGA
jgi:hypothetical protein